MPRRPAAQQGDGSRTRRAPGAALATDESAKLVPIRELVSYRISRVANAMSRSAAARYRREFGVSLGEWRILALLGSDAPLTLNRLARLAALDKGQMSRAVAKLSERGLILREFGGGRTTVLTLSREGQRIYGGLIVAANERDEAFWNCLTQRERTALDSALEKLAGFATTFDYQEQNGS